MLHSISGVYFIAALLDLFSSQLLTMTSTQIKDWMRDVAAGQDFWYQRLDGPALSPEVIAVLQDRGSKYVTWTEFVNGWIHATAGAAISSGKHIACCLLVLISYWLI